MATKKTTIAAEIKVDSSDASKSVGDLKKELQGVGTATEGSIAQLKELKKELKNTAAGSEDFKRLSAQIRDVEDGIENAKVGANDFAGALENASGPVGQLGRGLRQLEIFTSSWGAALKATGIGLLVTIVGTLTAAFVKNEGAMKKLEPIFTQFGRILNGILGAMEPFIDGLIYLATKALPYVSKAFEVAYSSLSSFLQGIGLVGSAVKKFISGDFAGAWDDAKKSVTEFVTRYEAANKRFISGSKELTDKEKEEQAKRLADKKAHDEKMKALAEKRAADEKARLEKAIEDRKAFDDFEVKRQQDAQKYIDEAAEKEKERLEKAANERKAYNDFYQKLIQEITNLEKLREDATIATNNAISQSWINLGNNISTSISNISKILGEGSELARVFGVAQVAISTAASIGSILLSGKQQQAEYNKAIAAGNATIGVGIANAVIPGMQGLAVAQIASGKAAVGSAVAGKAVSKANTLAQTISAGLAGATQIAAILSAGKGKSAPSTAGSSDPGSSNIVATPPLSPTPQTTTLNQAQVNQIGNVAARAYVVESDVSGNQERITRLNRAARIN